jgi:hypothetical protein
MIDEHSEQMRKRAVKRLKKRRDFWTHLLLYVMVSGFLVVIWAISDVHSFFWPIFPIVGWGIAVVLNAWDAFRDEDFTEEQIHREIEHIEHQR